MGRRGRLDGLDFGALPHGSIAMELDRPITLLADEATIREGIELPSCQREFGCSFVLLGSIP